MTDHPIPFSAPMVAALLAGTKIQTRRTLNPQPDWPTEGVVRTEITGPLLWPIGSHGGNYGPPVPAPRIKIGDRLWAKESYYQLGHWEPAEGKCSKGGRQKWAFIPDDTAVYFEEPAGETIRLGRHHKDPATVAWHKRLGRFMPKKYSRMTLIVTDVRVERLQDISEEDAIAEGITEHPCLGPYRGPAATFWTAGDGKSERGAALTPRSAYRNLWDDINGESAWDENPFVAAYSFRVVMANVDQIGEPK